MAQAVSRSITGFLATMTGSTYIQSELSVATSATVVPLGGVTSPGWCWFYNTDATNFVRIMNGSGGAKVVKCKALEPAFFRWDDTAVPYAIADTAAVLLEYLILSL